MPLVDAVDVGQHLRVVADVRPRAPVAAVVGDGRLHLGRPLGEIEARAADRTDVAGVAFLEDEHVARLVAVGEGLVDDGRGVEAGLRSRGAAVVDHHGQRQPMGQLGGDEDARQIRRHERPFGVGDGDGGTGLGLRVGDGDGGTGLGDGVTTATGDGGGVAGDEPQATPIQAVTTISPRTGHRRSVRWGRRSEKVMLPRERRGRGRRPSWPPHHPTRHHPKVPVRTKPCRREDQRPRVPVRSETVATSVPWLPNAPLMADRSV